MDTDELISQARSLQERIKNYPAQGEGIIGAMKAQVCEFFRCYAGPKSSFLQHASYLAASNSDLAKAKISVLIDSYIEYLEAGLGSGVSPQRRAQLEVVSDIMAQANYLVQRKECHPAASAMLAGAALEEFLRNWVEAEGLSIGNARPGIDAYCKGLRTADLLTAQDSKDITAWAGVRNNAAHGKWDLVSDRNRIALMLEGINLFMRQKS